MKLFTKSLVILIFVNYSFLVEGQTINTWTKMNDFLGDARKFAVSFVVNNKAYVGTGINSAGATTKDFWRYDPISDTWQEQAKGLFFPRSNAIAFAIGNKGYMGTGDVGTSVEQAANDFWEYDPVADVWTPKQGVGLTGRKSATAFVIGNKGYVTTGYLSSGTSYTYDNSLWEFDPTIGIDGQWTQRPDFPGIARGTAGAFAINNTGYVTGGLNLTYSDPNGVGATFRDLWSYDQTTQQWALKSTYPTSLVASGSASPFVEGFAVGNKGYIIGSNYFLEYDPSQNSFSSKGIPSSSSHVNSTAFSLCNFGYFATGSPATSSVASKNVYKYFSDQLDFTCPSIICYSNYTFSPRAVAPGSNITWTTSSNLTYVSGQGTASFTAKAATGGAGWIKLAVTTPCGQSYSFQHVVWVGNDAPSVTYVEVQFPDKPSRFDFTATSVPEATYQWFVNNTLQSGYTGNKFSTHIACGTKSVKCRITNPCGTSAFTEKSITVECLLTSSTISTYPNPIPSELTVSLDSCNAPTDIRLINSYQETVYATTTQELIIKIPVDKLPEGVYYLNIINKEGTLQKRVLITHP